MAIERKVRRRYGLTSFEKKAGDANIACLEFSKIKLLGGFCLQLVKGQGEPGLVAISCVFVENALGNGGIDRRHSRLQKVGGGSGIAGSDRGAQAFNGAANAGAVSAIHFRPLTRLRRAL